MLSGDLGVQALWVGTGVSAGLGGGSLGAALGGGHWLETYEHFPNPAFKNGSSKLEYLTKTTVSGLFTLCVTEVNGSEFSCSYIDYFPNQSYVTDTADSTTAIPYTVVRSGGFFLAGAVLLGAAEALCVGGSCCQKRRYLTFLAGVTFVITGLTLMLGTVIYIATLKGEIGDKLRSRSHGHQPLLSYAYGWSFLALAIALVCSMAAGTSSIFLFIYTQKREWLAKSRQAEDAMLPAPPPRPALLFNHVNHLDNHSIEFSPDYPPLYNHKKKKRRSSQRSHRSASSSRTSLSRSISYTEPNPSEPPLISELEGSETMNHEPGGLRDWNTNLTVSELGLRDRTTNLTVSELGLRDELGGMRDRNTNLTVSELGLRDRNTNLTVSELGRIRTASEQGTSHSYPSLNSPGGTSSPQDSPPPRRGIMTRNSTLPRSISLRRVGESPNRSRPRVRFGSSTLPRAWPRGGMGLEAERMRGGMGLEAERSRGDFNSGMVCRECAVFCPCTDFYCCCCCPNPNSYTARSSQRTSQLTPMTHNASQLNALNCNASQLNALNCNASQLNTLTHNPSQLNSLNHNASQLNHNTSQLNHNTSQLNHNTSQLNPLTHNPSQLNPLTHNPSQLNHNTSQLNHTPHQLTAITHNAQINHSQLNHSSHLNHSAFNQLNRSCNTSQLNHSQLNNPSQLDHSPQLNPQLNPSLPHMSCVSCLRSTPRLPPPTCRRCLTQRFRSSEPLSRFETQIPTTPV